MNDEIMTELRNLIEILHREGCSCVIGKGEKVSLYHQRGVKDLLYLLKTSPETLAGAMVADKVIGKGAAALMILGGVVAVHGDVVSEPAAGLLAQAGIPLNYGKLVPNIINRAGTGICPVETLCMECRTAADCLPLIEQFISKIHNPKE